MFGIYIHVWFSPGSFSRKFDEFTLLLSSGLGRSRVAKCVCFFAPQVFSSALHQNDANQNISPSGLLLSYTSFLHILGY